MIVADDISISRRERNKQDKRRRIVAAARKLFHSKGFEAATLQEVAEAADVGTGTLFLHVDGKEDLLILAFVEELTEAAVRSHDQVDRSLPFAEQAQQFMCGMFEYHLADPALSDHLVRAVTILKNKDRMVDLERLPLARLFDGLIRAARDRGEIASDVSVEDVGTVVFAAYLYCLHRWLNGQYSPELFRTQLRRMIELQARGFQVQPGAGTKKPLA